MEATDRKGGTMFSRGTLVKTKRDGREGVIVAADAKEIVVWFAPTGETMTSPWGEYTDAGQEGHYFTKYASRLIEVA
jgi:hypothetical protein